MEEVCFRPEIAAGLLHKQKTDPVTQEDIVDLALDSRAGKKHVMPQMSYHLVLNKADGAKEEAQALEICRLAEKRGFAQITVTAGGRQIQRLSLIHISADTVPVRHCHGKGDSI